ncbi:sulfatase-like hydrolase/transferase [Paenibacillus doosanensis]|uniref:sulfatase-like hydrolase/transferase n=1 Tax=Paenibacillus doosanensis TaxID=1229154 RepID=UPI0021803D90|nr:sulfatase-like hydrolase/transferase [Paenibacillus doosanensis]MCS7462417.1 sulfatase-like hydrolase/transferase [Paenibacillus doosanensis]
MKKKPNILFLMSDQHRADVTGYEGNPVIRTPHLDRLASTGAVFRNAYTPSPICIPSRQSMMAGQFPRTTGCETFGQDLPPGHMTFARRLSQYGYQTVVSGKLHHTGTDQMMGWTRRICGDMQTEPGYIEGKQEDEYAKYRVPSQKWPQPKEVSRAGVGRGQCISHDEYALEGALQFIDDYFNSTYYDREQIQPLLLKVSFLQPHYPYFTSEEKFTYYLNRVSPNFNEPLFDHPFLSKFRVHAGVDATERDIRRATAAYYGMIETIDGYFGQVMAALEHVGQNLDDWIIIYTSDHGEMLGEHGVWEKQKFFEASARVPLIIRYPAGFQGGRTLEENVNLCDLFATICDLCGIPAPEGLDSRSLEPLMAGDSAGWDNETVSQFGGTNLMIKRDHLKYQYYDTDGSEVLFDLARNKEETVNYMADPQYAEAVAQFRERAKELRF